MTTTCSAMSIGSRDRHMGFAKFLCKSQTDGCFFEVISNFRCFSRTNQKVLQLTVLNLLEQLGKTNTSVQQLLRRSVHVTAKLSESSNLTILSQIQLHRSRHLQVWQIDSRATKANISEVEINTFSSSTAETTCSAVNKKVRTTGYVRL